MVERTSYHPMLHREKAIPVGWGQVGAKQKELKQQLNLGCH
jgi:hypothetical protein